MPSAASLVLAVSVLLVLLGSWARAHVVDADGWAATTAPLASDPDVQSAVATALAADVRTAAATTVHAELAILPAGAVDSIADRVQSVALPLLQRAVRTQLAERAFEAGLRDAHRQAVAVLRGEHTRLVEDRSVVVDLRPVVVAVSSDIDAAARAVVGHLPLGLHLPDDPFGLADVDARVPVAELGRGRAGIAVADFAERHLVVCWVVASAAAAITVVTARRRTSGVELVGFTVAASALLTAIALRLGRPTAFSTAYRRITADAVRSADRLFVAGALVGVVALLADGVARRRVDRH